MKTKPQWPLVADFGTVARFVLRYRADIMLRVWDDPLFDFGRDDVRFNHSGD